MMSKEKTWISLLFSLALFVCLAGLHPVLAADDVIVTFTVKNSWQNETLRMNQLRLSPDGILCWIWVPTVLTISRGAAIRK